MPSGHLVHLVKGDLAAAGSAGEDVVEPQRGIAEPLVERLSAARRTPQQCDEGQGDFASHLK